jgi:hypothetical protein
MKKPSFLVLVFCCLINAIYAQNTESPVPQMDNAIKVLAGNIHRKLVEERAQKITVGQFAFRGSVPPLGAYWTSQLSAELTNISGRSYTVLSSGQAGADRTITGEIIEVAGVIRVYTRLIRSDDRAIAASFQSDFERSAAIAAMLTGGGRGDSPYVPMDEYEIDGWDNPVLYEIGSDSNATVMNRTFHTEDDEDFFLLVPGMDGRLVAETTGGIDTYMELYDYDTEDSLDENDDGGDNNNARIRYNVQAGKRYLAVVCGYSSSVTGSYGFRAYISPPREGTNSWSNPISYVLGSDESAAVVNRTLEERGDEDHFLLVPERDGRLVAETTGSFDTYMYLYDYETRELLDEDDDGAQSYNARIRYNVRAGKRYIAKVRGYDMDTGSYGFRAYLSGGNQLAPDEYEPDDELSLAKLIGIGTPQQHTFHSSDDVDWVRFQITRPGAYTIRVRGVRSNRLDTYIELYDANQNLIAEDDDGGSDRDSRLSLQLGNGFFNLKVWCLDEEPDQPYTVSITAE